MLTEGSKRLQMSCTVLGRAADVLAEVWQAPPLQSKADIFDLGDEARDEARGCLDRHTAERTVYTGMTGLARLDMGHVR